MKKRFDDGDKVLIRDVCEFAFGVNSRFSDINIPAKETAFWADALIQTHQAVPGKLRHVERGAYAVGLLDYMEKGLHDMRVLTVDLMRHVDAAPSHEIKPFELWIMLEAGIAVLATPEKEGPPPYRLKKLAEGMKHLRSATIPASGSYEMEWGTLSRFFHHVFGHGPLLPEDCLIYSQMDIFSEGVRSAFHILSKRGGEDISSESALEYASTIEKLDEALLFFAIYSCLAISEATAWQESEKMFGPEGWHSYFLKLPYYDFFAGHGGRMPLLRASMMLASILFGLSEGRRLGPAACALV